jgi:hypothetical protein
MLYNFLGLERTLDIRSGIKEAGDFPPPFCSQDEDDE